MIMYVTQIVTVRLNEKAPHELTHALFSSVDGWLKTWTPRANFKAVLTDTSAQGVEKCRQMLRTSLVPPWLKVSSRLFEFEVSSQELDEDSAFWMPSSVVWCYWHPVGE